MDLRTYPEPPSREEWGFLAELRRREERHVRWMRQEAAADELSMAAGVRVENLFGDGGGSLTTALDDLSLYLQETGLTAGGVPLRLVREEQLAGRESYELRVTVEGVTLAAEGTEGMRRAIYYFEDQLAGQDGPFLPLGTVKRKPWLKNRLSRCFFGPIKRPPFNRDELMDDMDYYPDEYLNRLAHEGVNGLWLTVVFRELAETSFTRRDPDAPRRLAKLRRTIAQCLRYGIKTWIFAIEPRSLAADDELLKTHPEFAGSRGWDGRYAFCTSSPAAQQYLYETMKDIFTQLPGLGGFLNISHGERITNCLSTVPAVSETAPNCPRCSQLPPWRIHREETAALVRGMKEANPEAEMISWLYQPQPAGERAEWLYELAREVPEGVILQYNFESGAQKKQLNRVRSGGDYWLSYIGPTEIFRRVADNVRLGGGELSAKIQVGCSHEVATVPMVSVPGLLYHKYRAMKACGCTSVMQCWYFGNYPGIMNRAAGELAFEEFADDEEAFLARLAKPQWGAQAAVVAAAWRSFTQGYAQYPLSNDMQYYGPMHAGVVWPLYLELENKPLAPTWKPDFPPSGDTLGECLENHTLAEALLLSKAMVRHWEEGLAKLTSLREAFAGDRERLLDIGVAEALGLQFRSARNIFDFYSQRRIYRSRRATVAERLAAVRRMTALVGEEMALSERLMALCRADSRLGFHSEAESHQYCESRLQWRVAQLRELRDGALAAAEARLAAGNAQYGESDYEQAVETYRLAEPHECVCGRNHWTLAAGEPGSGEVELCLRAAEAGTRFRVTLMDGDGTSFPWKVTVARGTFADTNQAVAVAFAEGEAGRWEARVRIPLSLWGVEGTASGTFYMYVEADDADGHHTWPEEKERPRSRLNIESFQADHCGRIWLG